MANDSPLKILTVGSAVGSIRNLFAKIKAIDAKHGKFDLVLHVGDFFGPPKEDGSVSEEVQELLDGKLEAPLECYISQGEFPLPEAAIQKFAKTGGDIGKNVFLLSKSAIVTTAQGLRIACLGGVYDPSAYATAETALGFTSPFFSRQTVDKLLANSASNTSMSKSSKNYSSLAAISSGAASSSLVDVLVTAPWASSIPQFSSLPSPELATAGASPVDVVTRTLKPRYHFASGAGTPRVFWEREPYVWDDEDGRIARFVSLGSFGGEQGAGKKQRWFYAFSIAPIAAKSEPPARPANATKNPFLETMPGQKRPHDNGSGDNFIWGDVQHPGKRSRTGGQDKPPPGYLCHKCQSTEHMINDCPERVKPPENYICKICQEPGHFVRDCPTRHAKGDTGGRKPKPGYVCRACGSEAHFIDDCPAASDRRGGGDHERGGRRRGPPKEISPDECWFCLSNPNLAKHLIVAVGSECYVTLPKGQLVPTHGGRSPTDIPGGGHVLIIPIAHYPTLASLSPDIASGVTEEIEKHKASLRQFYAKFGAGAVFFEAAMVRAKGGHAHIQAVPVPRALAGRVDGAFAEEARAAGVQFEEDAEAALQACSEGRRGYFRLDLPDGGVKVAVLPEHAPFSIQFGRQVMATLLGLQDRFDWKACAQSEEHDREDAAAFKGAFAPFDTSLE